MSIRSWPAARGVKLIGATAHYVNGDLDEGPIIEQAVERVIFEFGNRTVVLRKHPRNTFDDVHS